jgi:hypothetical protein
LGNPLFLIHLHCECSMEYCTIIQDSNSHGQIYFFELHNNDFSFLVSSLRIYIHPPRTSGNARGRAHSIGQKLAYK